MKIYIDYFLLLYISIGVAAAISQRLSDPLGID